MAFYNNPLDQKVIIQQSRWTFTIHYLDDILKSQDRDSQLLLMIKGKQHFRFLTWYEILIATLVWIVWAVLVW